VADKQGARVNVVYLVNDTVQNYPVITGPYITVQMFPDRRAVIFVRTTRHGNVLRSVHLTNVISVDRHLTPED
jgi:hypothetical protein